MKDSRRAIRDLERPRSSSASRGHVVFLLDGRLRVIAQSGAATRLLETGRAPVRIVAERLVPLERLLHNVPFGEAASHGEPAGGGRGVLLAESIRLRTRGAILVLAKLWSPAGRQGGGAAAAYLLTVYPGARRNAHQTGQWETAFDLTPTEARMAAEIWAGKTVKEAAAKLAIAASTAKSHLLSVFRKTGAAKQSDLVRILVDAGG